HLLHSNLIWSKLCEFRKLAILVKPSVTRAARRAAKPVGLVCMLKLSDRNGIVCPTSVLSFDSVVPPSFCFLGHKVRTMKMSFHELTRSPTTTFRLSGSVEPSQ